MTQQVFDTEPVVMPDGRVVYHPARTVPPRRVVVVVVVVVVRVHRPRWVVF
jgi:hypothetical protein